MTSRGEREGTDLVDSTDAMPRVEDDTRPRCRLHHGRVVYHALEVCTIRWRRPVAFPPRLRMIPYADDRLLGFR
jgi:hypothetical protein